jgi:multicomponent Na+:H+ antiporter subunit E
MSGGAPMSGEGPGGLWLRVSGAVWLVVAWVGITGSFTLASLLGGVAVSVVLLFLFPPVVRSPHLHRVRPLYLLRYLGHFCKEVVHASFLVAAAVVVPERVREHRGIIRVDLPPSSRMVEAILANAVSLTPGTSIIEVSEEPPRLHVHVLELHDHDEIRSSIAELHVRLVRAMGPHERLDEVERHARQLRERTTREEGR